jgi:hypothetical protein
MSLRRAAIIFAVFAVLGLASPATTLATPVRGSIPWDFIACKFSDTTTLPYPISYLQTKLLGKSVGSLADWISTVSYGLANLNGVTIHGYYTISETAAQAQVDENNSRGSVYASCKQAAASGSGAAAFTSSGHRGLSVITWPSIDTYGAVGYSMDDASQPVGEFAHEFGHGLGLNHSWSNDYNFYQPPGAGGDYNNQWDEMSYGDVYRATTAPDSTYGSGPGLDGYHLEALGWIPMSRVVSFGADGVQSKVVTLAPLNHPEVSGNLLVRIPMDPSNPLHYFTVEYVTADGYYSGVPGGQILINEVVQPNVAEARAFPTYTKGWSTYYTSYLQRELGKYLGTGDGPPLQTVTGTKFTIVFQSIVGQQAKVLITDTAVTKAQAQSVYGPNTCVEGYVWRIADANDYVCVAPAVRLQTIADNAAAGSRHQSGSAACKAGYVWRGAFPNDQVCVTPATRAQAVQDNANTGSRYVIPLNSNT